MFLFYVILQSFNVPVPLDVTNARQTVIQNCNNLVNFLQFVSILVLVLHHIKLNLIPLGPYLVQLGHKFVLLRGCRRNVHHFFLFGCNVKFYQFSQSKLTFLQRKLLNLQNLLYLDPMEVLETLISEGNHNWHCLFEIIHKLLQTSHRGALGQFFADFSNSFVVLLALV